MCRLVLKYIILDVSKDGFAPAMLRTARGVTIRIFGGPHRMRSITQNIFQCTFDFALLAAKEIEPAPSGSRRVPRVHTPPSVKRCTKPHNIFQCSFDEVLLGVNPFCRTRGKSTSRH